MTTTALANLFVAVREMENVCLVLSDLAGTNFSIGQSNLEAAFNRAVQGITSEARRIAVPITPVNPNGDELYHILRKRLFEHVAPKAEIEKVAAAYREALREASKMNLRPLSRNPSMLALLIPIRSIPTFGNLSANSRRTKDSSKLAA